MMTGTINTALEASLSLRIIGSGGTGALVDAVIDTGFNGFLTLPSANISSLRLASQGVRRAMLGNGTTVSMPIYVATVMWDGQPQVVQALEAEGAALIGMRLLHGRRVTLDVVAGGSVTIEPKP